MNDDPTDIRDIAKTITKNNNEKGLNVPDPTQKELNDPIFNVIYQTIKSWDISTDGGNSYTGATGNHAAAIARNVHQALDIEHNSTGLDNTVHLDVRGLSRSGKTTILAIVAKALEEYNFKVFIDNPGLQTNAFKEYLKSVDHIQNNIDQVSNTTKIMLRECIQ